MSSSAHRLLARVGRWPRRIAALVCLLLAAASALLPSTSATPTSSAEHGVGAHLGAGEVAVAVPIGSVGAPDIRAGDRVGLLAQPAEAAGRPAVLVADHLRVVSIKSDSAGIADVSAVIVVATDRRHALELARYLPQPLLLMIDYLP